MTPQELFGVLIRIIGLMLVLYGLNLGTDYLTGNNALQLVLVLLFGIYLLGGAAGLVAVAYRRKPGAA